MASRELVIQSGLTSGLVYCLVGDKYTTSSNDMIDELFAIDRKKTLPISIFPDPAEVCIPKNAINGRTDLFLIKETPLQFLQQATVKPYDECTDEEKLAYINTTLSLRNRLKEIKDQKPDLIVSGQLMAADYLATKAQLPYFKDVTPETILSRLTTNSRKSFWTTDSYYDTLDDKRYTNLESVKKELEDKIQDKATTIQEPTQDSTLNIYQCHL